MRTCRGRLTPIRCLSIFVVLLAACRGVNSLDENDKPVGGTPEAAQAVPPTPPEQALSPAVYVSRRSVEIPVPLEKLKHGRAIEVWYTRDQGQNWAKLGGFDPAGQTVPFEAPHDGSFGFILGCMTPEGKWSVAPHPGDVPEWRVVVDTTPPVVEVLSPNGGEVFASGKSTVVRWVAEDANMALGGLRVEVSAGGNTWVAVGKDLANSGKYHWDIGPITGSAFRVRVVAQDMAGNVGSDDSDAAFAVDGLAPDVRPISPAVSAQDPAEVEWRGGDLGAAGLKRVTLYVTRDNGQNWERYGDDEDLISPVVLRELDGVYGLCLVAEDGMGNANAAPLPGTPPQHVILLDRTLPDVKLFSPAAGGYLGGVALDVQWVAKDNVEMPDNWISFFYSADDGKSWKEIAREAKNDGLYKWTPPRTPGANYRFKLAASDFAGNVREIISEPFGIDTAAPEAVAIGPGRSGTHTVQIQYEIKNRGSAAVHSVTLFYRPEGVGEWLKYGEDPDMESPFTFAKGDGRYGLYMTCATEQGQTTGFAQRTPDPDVEPQCVMEIDATPPKLELLSFNGGGFIRSGSVAPIVWKMEEPNPDAEGLEIYHSPDGGAGWQLVAAKVDPRRGEYGWEVPSHSGARHLVRLVATDAFGNRGQVESAAPFTIDDDLPRVAVLDQPPAGSRSGRVSVHFKAADPTSGISRVILYGRPLDGEVAFKPLAESVEAEGKLDAEIAGEGRWGFLVVSLDGAGHASGAHEATDRPDFECVFDTVPPVVHLRRWMLPSTKSTWVNSVREVEWSVQDEATRADKIRVRVDVSWDGGQSWQVALPYHANEGKADLRAQLFSGRLYRVRVLAMDEAGNEREDVSGDFDPGEVAPPSLVLVGIDPKKNYGIGSILPLTWKSSDEAIREVAFELSRDDGKTWTPLVTSGTKDFQATLPDEEGMYQARLAGRDLLDRPTLSTPLAFRALLMREQLKLEVADTVEAGHALAVTVHPAVIFRMKAEVTMEVFDGQKWESAEQIVSERAEIRVTTVPGEYPVRFRMTLPDERELVSKETKFKVVDTTAPALSLQTCDGGAVQAGKTEKVRWAIIDANPDPAGMTILHSRDDGANWTVVAERVDPMKGEYDWAVPQGSGLKNKIRLTAADRLGNKAQVESGRSFIIDDDPPRISLLKNPPVMIRSGRVTASYRATDATSGVAKVVLFGRSTDVPGGYTALGESAAAEGDVSGDVLVEGMWEFLVVAVDQAGRMTADVGQAPKPDFVCRLDSTPPVAVLTRLALPDGRPTWVNSNWEAEWTAEDKVSPSDKIVIRVAVSWDEGGTWAVVVPQHPNSGKTDMRPFIHAGEKIRLRLVATDEAGNEGEDISGDFDPGDVPPPAMVLKGLEENGSYPMGSELDLSWISTDATVKDAVLEWSSDGGKTWTPAGTLPKDGGKARLPVEEGAYQARIMAKDFLGRVIASNPVPFRAEITADHLQVAVQGDVEAGTTATLAMNPESLWKMKAEVWGEIHDGEKWVRAGEVREGAWTLNVVPPLGERKVRMGVKLADGRELVSKEASVGVVDKTAPVVELRRSELPGNRSVWVNGDWEAEWAAKDVVTPPEKLAVGVDVSADEGKTWQATADLPAGAMKASLQDHLKAGLKCRVRVSVKDESGNKGEAVSGDFDPADVTPAIVTWSGIESGKGYPPAGEVSVAWSSQDAEVKDVELQLSRDGGETWLPAGTYGREGGKATLPREEGSCWARLAWKGRGEEPLFSSEVAFRVIVGPESLFIRVPATVALGSELKVTVGPAEIFDAGRKVWLELRVGTEWTKLRDLLQESASVDAPRAPGEYGVRVVVAPADGPEWPPKEARFEVKKESFTIRLDNFRGGDIVPGGRGRLIALRTSANLSDLAVEYSAEGGHEGTWKEVPRADLEEFRGNFLWKRLPMTTGANYRLRVRHVSIAGVSDESEKDFAIDATPPGAVVTGPLEETPIPVSLQVDTVPSLSPIREMTLYVSRDDGTTWTEESTYTSERSVVFRPAAPGDYGVYLTARSAVGLRGEPPVPGTPPQAVIRARGGGVVRTPSDEGPPPVGGPVTLTSELPSKVKGGLPVALSWSSAGTAETATVSFVSDGSKEVIQDGQPATGRLMWNVPRTDMKGCRIVVEVDGKSVTSPAFEIDSSAPTVGDVEVEVGGR